MRMSLRKFAGLSKVANKKGMRTATVLQSLVMAGALVFGVAVGVRGTVAHAQASTAAGSIAGTIMDGKGAVIPQAAITIKNIQTGATRKVTSDGSGYWTAGSLNPGNYSVSVTAPGFSTATETVVVQIGNVSNGNIKLAVGSTTQEVDVTADETVVNTTQSTVGGVLTTQQIDTLPISGRNFLDLAQLQPGVQLQSGETFDPTKAGYSSISINGVNGRTARILLDGQDISDETVGTTTMNVSQGSIQEFEISRSSLDISNELTSSGAVTVSTRSGTNAIHGQAFGLFRDQRSGAAAAPGGTNYPFQRNQFGGRIGGPIIKDKLFYFANAERVKQDAFNSVQVAAPFQALSGGYTSPFRDNYDTGRIDYNAPAGVHLFFRGSYENNLDDSTYGYGYSRYGNKDNTYALAGGADFVTGRFIHSLRWSYLKFHNLIGDQTGSGVPNLAPGVELDINGLYTGPNLLAPQQTYQSDKQFRYDSGFNVKNHQFQYGVSLNRILGGGFASFFGLAPQVQGDFQAGPVDGASFASDPTDYSTSLVILGNGEGYNTEIPSFNNPAGGQGDWRLGIYFGDTWKMTPRLTVNYGVRYSRDTGRSDSDLAPIPCSAAVAVWGANSPCTTGNLLDALTTPSGQSLNLGGRVRQPNSDFGPKFGFAYDLKGDGKTVIRGGLGIYFENNIFNNVLFDRPARLATGLFFGTGILQRGQSSFTLPNGTKLTSINGVPISSLTTESIKTAAPSIAALQTLFQTTTKADGPASNSNYVANSLYEDPGVNGYAMYAPNFRTARSIQINIGMQRQVWKGAVFTADYVRNVGEHFQQAIDVNHDGAASTLNTAAAQNAIATTTAQMGCTGGYSSAAIDCAIAAGATIQTFAQNGLDSGITYEFANPAAALGLTPNTGAAFGGVNPMFGAMFINYPMGRSTYNGLQTNLTQQGRLPFSWITNANLSISYTLGKFITTGGADQNFTPTAVDNINPLSFAGPGGTDRTDILSYGGTLDWKYGIETSVIGHYESALPTTLALDTNGAGPGEIFSSDVTGDGTIGDILPGYKAGSFMRTVKPKDLPRVIANWNATGAGKLTPAGQSLVTNGLFTQAQLTSIGAVTRSIAGPPTGNVGNGSLRTFDFTLSRLTRVKWLGPAGSIEPAVNFFNLFNMSNFGNVAGNLTLNPQDGTANGTDSSLSSRGALRTGNGSGVFTQGAPRILEYSLKINF